MSIDSVIERLAADLKPVHSRRPWRNAGLLALIGDIRSTGGAAGAAADHSLVAREGPALCAATGPQLLRPAPRKMFS